MSQMTKTLGIEPARLSDDVKPRPASAKVSVPNPPETDVLHFLSRTLQAHFLDAEPQDILAKLRNLKSALDQQEITLSGWPDSQSKERMCAALAKAKNLITQIADEFGAAAGDPRSSVSRRIPAISSARRSAAYRD